VAVKGDLAVEEEDLVVGVEEADTLGAELVAAEVESASAEHVPA
jgi:hypothetical protein